MCPNLAQLSGQGDVLLYLRHKGWRLGGWWPWQREPWSQALGWEVGSSYPSPTCSASTRPCMAAQPLPLLSTRQGGLDSRELPVLAEGNVFALRVRWSFSRWTQALPGLTHLPCLSLPLSQPLLTICAPATLASFPSRKHFRQTPTSAPLHLPPLRLAYTLRFFFP